MMVRMIMDTAKTTLCLVMQTASEKRERCDFQRRVAALVRHYLAWVASMRSPSLRHAYGGGTGFT
ncbi:hypothetical protein J2Y41_003840 [Arthrobacter sp. 1088]|nr:hypothetical protein [Arthrobacter sp. 1088]